MPHSRTKFVTLSKHVATFHRWICARGSDWL